MLCRFTGIFYVKFTRYDLSCYNIDSLGSRRDVQIHYFPDTDVDSPYPEILTRVEQEKAYLIMSSFVHLPRKVPLVIL